jgi:hypothetical protein
MLKIHIGCKEGTLAGTAMARPIPQGTPKQGDHIEAMQRQRHGDLRQCRLQWEWGQH